MDHFKSELSRKNPYWLSKHRYMELEHFCLQYPEWKELLKELESHISQNWDSDTKGPISIRSLEDLVIKRDQLQQKIDMVDEAGRQCDDVIGMSIVKAVTEGLSFEAAKAECEVPYEKDAWYNRRRFFFWLLDKKRN